MALYQSFLVTLTPLNLLCRENENKASFSFCISLDF